MSNAYPPQVDYTSKAFDQMLDEAVAAQEASDSEPAWSREKPEKVETVEKTEKADSDFSPGSESAKESNSEEEEEFVRTSRFSRRNVPAVSDMEFLYKWLWVLTRLVLRRHSLGLTLHND